MHRQIFEWIREKYPHPEHKFSNGAIPASGMLAAGLWEMTSLMDLGNRKFVLCNVFRGTYVRGC